MQSYYILTNYVFFKFTKAHNTNILLICLVCDGYFTHLSLNMECCKIRKVTITMHTVYYKNFVVKVNISENNLHVRFIPFEMSTPVVAVYTLHPN